MPKSVGERQIVKTLCNRDCPDTCGIVAEVEDGRVVRLRGDKEHPITQGFLCFRTSRFLDRQYHPGRLLKPLLRHRGEQVEIPFDEALDIAADRLSRIKEQSGGASILHYRSGGSLGLTKVIADHFFAGFGPVTVKAGDICSGAGDAAQLADFGDEDSNDVFDLLHAKHIINWGKNLFVSNVHLIPIIKEARRGGATVTLIDPVRTRSCELSDRYLQIRPDGDSAFALLIARIMFEDQLIHPSAAERCENLEAFERLCFSRSKERLLEECDLSLESARAVAQDLADGPTAILVGWGLQRRLRGGTHVRMLDALSAISGNLGRRGGGVSFYYKRRGAFDLSFQKDDPPPPRRLLEPLLGQEICDAKDPPIRAIWVTAGNPVAMLPDSASVARAFESVEFSVVVDSFATDTTRRASLVLPTTTLLEDDDLLGSYGHHFIGVSRPVVPPPPDVRSDLEILQALAQRVGLGHLVEGDARSWKARMLQKVSDRGASLAELEQSVVRNPLAPVIMFEDGKVSTPSSRTQLVAELPARDHVAPLQTSEPTHDAFPLWLFSNSTDRSQSSQWAVEPQGRLPARVHPDVVPGLAHGANARLVSEIGWLSIRIEHDPGQRKDVVVVPKGGHFDRGWAANALIRARPTDIGGGAAYQSARVRIEPES